MKYLFIAQHMKTWLVDLMCRLLGVTRSAYLVTAFDIATRKLMQEAGVQVKRRKKYKVMTNSNHK
jgi:hypothetical protein